MLVSRDAQSPLKTSQDEPTRPRRERLSNKACSSNSGVDADMSG